MQDWPARILEAVWSPRASMRRLLAESVGPDMIVGLVVLGYVVQAMAALAIPGARPMEPENPLAWHVGGLVTQGILYLMSVGTVHVVGRLFGGTGSVPQAFAAMAWYSFTSAFLSPLALGGLAGLSTEEPSPLAALLLLLGTILGIRMFAGFVAELHGFRNSWTVFAVALGLAMAASVLLSLLVQAPS